MRHRHSSKRYEALAHALLNVTTILAATAAIAQQPAYLLKDVNAAPVAASSMPHDFVRGDTVTYFLASTPQTGRELWVTDGTEAGTRLVSDSEPGPAEREITGVAAIGDQGFFTEIRETGTVENSVVQTILWASDGTAAGAHEVIRVMGPSDDSDVLVAAGRRLFFAAHDSSIPATNVWESDGTAAGTQIVHAFSEPNFTRVKMAPLADGIVFAGVSENEYQLWYANAASATFLTTLTGDSVDCLSRLDLTAIGGQMYFVASDGAGCALWKTDGTAQGTGKVRGGLGTAAGQLTELAGQAFFVVGEGAAGQSGIWRSDGSEDGTVPIAAMIPEDAPGLIAAGGRLFFATYRPDPSVVQLWSSDTTGALIQMFAEADGTLFPTIAPLGNQIVFKFPSSESGTGLWISDGTQAGTRLVRELNPAGDAGVEFASPGTPLLFAADDGVTGDELWATDGTPEGTRLVRNIAPDDEQTLSSSAHDLVRVGDIIYFVTSIPPSFIPDQLWKTDGSADGTVLLHGPLAPITQFTALDDRVFFAAGPTLWTSDGTPDGTVALTTPDESSPSSISDLTRLVNVVIFLQRVRGGSQLCRSDGTVAGTQCFASGGSGPRVAFGDELFFLTDFADTELWAVADGQSPRLVKDIPRGSLQGVGPQQLAVSNGRLLFFANDGTHGMELWRSDGTADGTTLLADIHPGTAGSQAGPIVDVAGNAYFAADDGVHGTELWRTDGTPTGTELVADLVAGSAGSNPVPTRAGERLFLFGNDGNGWVLWTLAPSMDQPLRLQSVPFRDSPFRPFDTAIDVDGSLAFTWCDELEGCEPWISDGTVAGTHRLADIAAGIASSSPEMSTFPLFAALGSQLLVAADDFVHGRELWAIPLAAGTACPGDCSGNGQVTIDELITAVAIALGQRPVDACTSVDTDHDGNVTVAELVAAVNRALVGCSAS